MRENGSGISPELMTAGMGQRWLQGEWKGGGYLEPDNALGTIADLSADDLRHGVGGVNTPPASLLRL